MVQFPQVTWRPASTLSAGVLRAVTGWVMRAEDTLHTAMVGSMRPQEKAWEEDLEKTEMFFLLIYNFERNI